MTNYFYSPSISLSEIISWANKHPDDKRINSLLDDIQSNKIKCKYRSTSRETIIVKHPKAPLSPLDKNLVYQLSEDCEIDLKYATYLELFELQAQSLMPEYLTHIVREAEISLPKRAIFKNGNNIWTADNHMLKSFDDYTHFEMDSSNALELHRTINQLKECWFDTIADAEGLFMLALSITKPETLFERWVLSCAPAMDFAEDNCAFAFKKPITIDIDNLFLRASDLSRYSIRTDLNLFPDGHGKPKLKLLIKDIDPVLNIQKLKSVYLAIVITFRHCLSLIDIELSAGLLEGKGITKQDHLIEPFQEHLHKVRPPTETNESFDQYLRYAATLSEARAEKFLLSIGYLCNQAYKGQSKPTASKILTKLQNEFSHTWSDRPEDNTIKSYIQQGINAYQIISEKSSQSPEE